MSLGGFAEERAGECCVGFTRRDRQSENLSRESIEDRADHDGAKEASNLGEIDNVSMPRSLGTEGRAGVSGRLRASAWGRASEDSLDARSGGLESQPGQNPGDSPCSPARPFAVPSAKDTRIRFESYLPIDRRPGPRPGAKQSRAVTSASGTVPMKERVIPRSDERREGKSCRPTHHPHPTKSCM